MSEFQSSNINLEKLSRRERLRVIGVQAVCAGLVNTPAERPYYYSEADELDDIGSAPEHKEITDL